MAQVEEIRDAARSAGGALRNAAIWSALARSVFSWGTLGIVLGALVVAVVLGLLGAVLLPHAWAWPLGLPLAIWILPRIVRRVCCEVSRRSLAPLARAGGLTEQTWPGIGQVRAWWLPFIIVMAMPLSDWGGQLLPLFPFQLGQFELPPLAIAVFALSVALATRPLARTALAPWFEPAQVDAAVARERSWWSGLVAAFMLLAVAVRAGVRAVLEDGGGLELGWHTTAFSMGHLLTLGFLEWMLGMLALLVVAVPAIAAFAWLAARRLTGGPRPESTMAPRVRRRAGVAGPAAAVFIAAAGLLWLMRAQLIVPLLGADFRARVAVAGSWDNPITRQLVHTQLACDGRDSTLRALHWAGVDSDGGDFDGALACAITEGHASTVELLLRAGADMTQPTVHPNLGRGPQPLRLAPIGWAMQSSRALAAAPLLLARGASLTPPGALDTVQIASTAHCLPCLEWLAGQGVAFTATDPSTPMTLWIAESPRGVSAAGALDRLAALGMSATATGSDRRTPLLAAAASADAASVSWLLARGADPAATDGHRMTPLDWATQTYAMPNSGAAAAGPGSQAERDAITLQLLEVTPPPGPGSDRVGDTCVRSAAGHSAAIFLSAHRLGWPLESYDAWFLDAMAPEAARDFIAHQDDATVAALLPVRSGFIGIAAAHGWWNELARAASGWRPGADPVDPDSRSCQLVVRGVRGELDDSAQAVVSWKVVQAAHDAGMRFDRCDGQRIAQGLAGRSAAQQAQWVLWTGQPAVAAGAQRP